MLQVAEDHLNTLALMTKGWNGVYIPEVIAEGDGPEILNTYLVQQYAWARSMSQILFSHSFKYMRKLSWRRRMQYGFIQTWYQASSLTYLTLFLIPLISLFTNQSPVRMTGFDYFIHFPALLIAIGASYWAARPLMQPANVGMSWRGPILHLIRWPVLLQATGGVIMGRKKPYQITPKGKFGQIAPTTKLYQPFLFLSSLCASAVVYATLAYGSKAPTGQILFALLSLLIMLSVCLIDLNIRIRLNGRALRTGLSWFRPITAVGVATVFAALAIVLPLSPNQTTLAYSTAPEKPLTPAITSQAPQLLSDKELMEEIANPTYHINGDLPVPKIGIYNPHKIIPSKQGYIRHTFVDWHESRKTAEQLLISERLHTTPLITIEPKGELDGGKLLADISSGADDSVLKAQLNILAASPNKVYVRFAHEMDLGDIYPWGGQDPEAYISAYRHVVDLSRSLHMNNLQWVWSPAGNVAAPAYYPGDNYVDIVGTTILYIPNDYQGQKPSFNQLQSSRDGLKLFGKPVWIAELGFDNSDAEYQKFVLNEAVNEFAADGYEALVYIDIPDSNLSGPDYRLLDLNELGNTFNPPSTDKPIDIKPDQNSGSTKKSRVLKTQSTTPETNTGALRIISKHY